MLRYQLFPRSVGMDDTIKKVIDCFERHFGEIDSSCHSLKSDEVLKAISPELIHIPEHVRSAGDVEIVHL